KGTLDLPQDFLTFVLDLSHLYCAAEDADAAAAPMKFKSCQGSRRLLGTGVDGCRDCDGFIPILQLISLLLLATFLVAFLVKGSEVHSSQEQEQEKQRIHQELDQLKAGLDCLCHPCPWDWTLFQRNCYFFSTFQQTWMESVSACQEVGAKLVVIKSGEEQSFLQQSAKKKGGAWMGLSDIKKEGKWRWVDDSPLKTWKYWSPGEPSGKNDEDCAEFSDNGWNDSVCFLEKFWICKKPASPYS
ncbi:hypothetical protein U0070_022610, partial [Myodes glareolus]